MEPVFEKGDISFAVTTEGPGEPATVTLAHKESGKEIQLDINDIIAVSNRTEISHQMMNVGSSNEGMYFFKVQFTGGLEIQTAPVELVVKRKCRPLTPPPNTGTVYIQF